MSIFDPLTRAGRRTRAVSKIAPIAGRALPLVNDLRVHAIDSPDFIAGAETMRAAVLDVLTQAAAETCRCHPDFHELGVHAPGVVDATGSTAKRGPADQPSTDQPESRHLS